MIAETGKKSFSIRTNQYINVLQPINKQAKTDFEPNSF